MIVLPSNAMLHDTAPPRAAALPDPRARAVAAGTSPCEGLHTSPATGSHAVTRSACMGDGERAGHGRPSLAVRGGLVVNAVDTDGSVVEYGGALGSRVACGQPFERIVHN